MAVVLDALAPHVMRMIEDMGEEKIRMLLGVSDEIKKLEGNVEPLQNLLTDAERRRITDKRVQAWVRKLKNAMYEATDILDLCQLEAMERQEEQHSSSNGGGASTWLCSLEGLLWEKLPFVGCLADILQPFLFCPYFFFCCTTMPTAAASSEAFVVATVLFLRLSSVLAS